ncbi:MAG: serine hydrolase [Hyphomicrobiales bacterium]|nr:serine hydrolase [Hyphomicrobiales bacterium]
MIRRLAIAGACVVLTAAAWFRVDLALRVVPGYVASEICLEHFVSGRDAALAFEQIPRRTPGMRLLTRAVSWRVDDDKREARATLAGLLSARVVDVTGYGCILDHGAPMPAPIVLPSSPARAEQPIVAPPPGSPLALALDHVFAPFADGRPRDTQAVVIMQSGRIAAERYAEDATTNTLLAGFSLTKSLTNALIGLLVRDGVIDVTAPGEIAAWRAPDDPRREITIENLLRMESGLDFDETNSGFDANTHMLYLEDDMAAYSAEAKAIARPGTRWAYSSSGIVMLDRVLRDKIGGPDELVRFAHERLFGPAGMSNVILGFDATGTFVGGTYSAMTARDWARFGQVFLDDGTIDGKRILPQGWADFSAAPTAAARLGYGAGFWTNRGDSFGAKARVDFGFPTDSYFGSGSMGQRLVVIPSEGIVIARLGRTADWPDFDIVGTGRLVREVVAALKKT